MNILVTVGTTPFKSLIDRITQVTKSLGDSVCVTFQTAECNQEYSDKENYFSFIENISNQYKYFDLVITHAGAGSIYTLLDMNTKIIVVPNLDRNDKHQIEMANFVLKNNYGSVAYLVKDIDDKLIYDAVNSKFKTFVKEPFFLRGYVFGENQDENS